MRIIDTGDGDALRCVAYAADGRDLIAAADPHGPERVGRVRAWPLLGGDPAVWFAPRSATRCDALSGDGDRSLWRDAAGEVVVLTLDPVRGLVPRRTNWIAAGFCPLGAYAAGVPRVRRSETARRVPVELCDLDAGDIYDGPGLRGDPPSGLAVSVGAGDVAIVAPGRPVTVHPLHGGDRPGFRLAGPGHADHAAYSRDGRWLVAFGYDWVGVWDATAGRPVWRNRDRPSRVTALAVAPSGDRLAVGDAAGRVSVHTLPEGTSARAYAWDVGPIRSLAIAPDELTCAAVGSDGRVVVWDVDG